MNKQDGTSVQEIVNVKPNSYEFGKAGNRFKIYFDGEEDGKKVVQACKSLEDFKLELFEPKLEEEKGEPVKE